MDEMGATGKRTRLPVEPLAVGTTRASEYACPWHPAPKAPTAQGAPGTRSGSPIPLCPEACHNFRSPPIANARLGIGLSLGTFYLHKGDFDNGILYIRKALQINPDAHFGREEYQLRLAEFLREGRSEPRRLRATDFLLIRDGMVLTPAAAKEAAETGLTEFTRAMAAVVASTQPATTQRVDPDEVYADPDVAVDIQRWAYRGRPERLREMGFKDNVFDGIVGMIRFGTGTSSELYLTLGDLLVLRGDKNLAYRAYQRALDLDHTRKKYLEAVMKALSDTIYDTTSIQPEAIAADRANAEAWVSAYQNYEDQLLREGKDVDDEANYARFYREFGPAMLPQPFRAADYVNPKNYDTVNWSGP
jgi:tetratricopeptide (TPR) repeat protein